MYSEMFQLHAELLKALSHPKRLEVIHLLRDQELSVSEIQEMLDLPQANLSQHLMILRDAEIVITRRDGKQIYYSLAHENIVRASDLIREILIDKNKDKNLKQELSLKMKDLVPITHDPVCRMRLSPKTAGFSMQYEGNEYYFCASGCLKTFKENMVKYARQ